MPIATSTNLQRRQKSKNAKKTNPKVFDNFHHVLHSNPHASNILNNLDHDVHQPELSDDEVMALFNQPNSQQLSSFKEDMSLIVRFHAAVRDAECDNDETAS
jgi:hypothetical protein